MLHQPNTPSLFPRLHASLIDRFRTGGTEMAFATGDVLIEEGELNYDVFVVLEGSVRILRTIGGRRELLAVHGPQEFTGDLAVLLCDESNIRVEAAEPVRVLRVQAATVRAVIGTCSPFSRELLSAMSARSRDAERQLRQHEKMLALGKLAAGVAHELDNPASALARSGKQLQSSADAVLRAIACPLTAEQNELLVALHQRLACRTSAAAGLELADREEELAAWLDIHGVAQNWAVASTLAQRHVRAQDMELLLQVLQPADLPALLDRLNTVLVLSSCAEIVSGNSGHISHVVDLMKQHTNMDREVRREINVHDGLNSSLEFVASHERDRVTVERDYAPRLPSILANPAELNQVWSNLFENALEAMSARGHLRVATSCNGSEVVVHVCDNGCGIEQQHIHRIFEPFFTTKPVGKGLGLGLDVAYDIITHRHGGRIFVESVPGDTRFEVRLPVAEA